LIAGVRHSHPGTAPATRHCGSDGAAESRSNDHADATFVERRLPIGAEVTSHGTHFRVWAPDHERVDVLLGDDALASNERSPDAPARRASRVVALVREDDGYFSGHVEGAGEGTLYRYRLDGGETFPDPASRYQPRGPHGPSSVIDPSLFEWSDHGWKGVAIEGQVIYELHIGTFTREGTWAGAMRELPRLADLGVTTLEVMPVADFAGRFGWGYDGVCLYAPTRLYGTPDDFRRFVDRAHALGLGVILDVVYNHLGPDGNFLPSFSSRYLRREEPTEWGAALNFDGDGSGPVRELFVENAGYWIDEFHLDGLRLDATQSIRDRSPRPVVAEIVQRARTAAGSRSVIVVAENEPQHSLQLRPPREGGYGLDGMWNDDFHHAAMVALTGRDEAYYTDYRGRAQEFVSMAKYGFLYQGQYYKWQRARRGSPTFGIPPARFIVFIQNHDQVANSVRGQRIHELASPAAYRAMTALLLLLPQTPMLFQGQEFAASAPFVFFADHSGDLAEVVRRGRAEFLSQFESAAGPPPQEQIAAPDSLRTFERCVIDHAERERNSHVVALHRDLLRMRRDDRCFARQRSGACDGAVLDDRAFVLRYFGEDGDDRLVCVNLGPPLHLDPAPEPLLAPPEQSRWRMRWSSEDPRYGGLGTPAVDAPEADRTIASGNAARLLPRENWRLLGNCTVVLAPVRTE